MLSAMNSASYKSSLEPENTPRDEQEIREDLRRTEERIEFLVGEFGETYTIIAADRLNIDEFFEAMDRLKIILPPLYDDLDTFEEELKQATYEPDYDLMAKEES